MATKRVSSRGKTKKLTTKSSSRASSAKSRPSASVKSSKSSKKFNVGSLRNWNLALAFIFLAQAVVLLIISKNTSLPLVDHYLAKDDLASQVAGKPVWALAVHHLFDIHLASLLAAVLVVAAVVRGLAATLFAKQYQDDIDKRVNKMRWAECGLAGGLGLVSLGLINGIYDLSQLVTLFALTLLCATFLFVLEQYRAKFAPWIVNTFAVLTALLPWLVIAQYLKAAVVYGVGLPHYVYWVDGVLFGIFILQAINFYLQRHGKGQWASYVYSEQTFLILSLASYSTLAWVVFAGALR